VTSYTDNTVSANTTYSYTIKAYDTAGNVSNASDPATVTTPPPPDTTPPAKPTGLTAEATAYYQVDLSWNANAEPDLAGYFVFRDGVLRADVTGTSWTDNSVAGNTTYTYTVKAYDTSNNVSVVSDPAVVTTPDSPDTTPPDRPTGLVATATAYNQVQLSWNPNTEEDLAGYRVYRNGQFLGSVAATEYADNAVSAETSYTYEVRAYDMAGNESAGATINVTTPAAPQPPVGEIKLTVSATTNESVTLAWQPLADPTVTMYRIYQDGQIINTTPADINQYTVTGLQGGKSYEFYVTAVNNDGEGPPSNIVKVVPSFLVHAKINDILSTSKNIFVTTWPITAFSIALSALPVVARGILAILARRW
jgi:chitodextrinase